MLDGAGRELLDAVEPHHTLDGDGAVRPDRTPVLGLGESGESLVEGHHEGDDLVALLFDEGADDEVGDGLHLVFFWVVDEK